MVQAQIGMIAMTNVMTMLLIVMVMVMLVVSSSEDNASTSGTSGNCRGGYDC